MKISDTFRLILNEYKYEKKEWILSLGLQWLIFTSVFFLFTVSGGIDEVCSVYMKPLYENGYDFFLEGYSQQDVPELTKMGFYDISFSDQGETGYAVTDNLDKIWIYKFKATFSGKDIWNKDLDETLGIMFFCQIMLGAIGIVMLIIMINNLSNSYTMKLIRRKNYIKMLRQLGCTKKSCKQIYYGFFCMRSIIALTMAVGINSCIIRLLNRYVKESMHIAASFSEFDVRTLLVTGIVSLWGMWISFQKQLRKTDEI